MSEHGGTFPSGIVTFLVTGVEDTAAMRDVAPAALASALSRHDAIVRRATETYGGTVVRAQGEREGMFAVFSRPIDALIAARGAQLALVAEPWPAEASLRVRIAVHTGEGAEAGGTYAGPAVERVARLLEAGAGGEILVSQVTATLVKDHVPTDSVLIPRDDQTAHDTVFELRSQLVADLGPGSGSSAVPPVPLPPRVATPPLSGFHGRIAERLVIERALRESVAGGGRRIVLVAGEPGIGKTALAADAARQARREGAIVLYGRCDEDLGVPYQPWVESISYLAEHFFDALRRRLTPRQMGDLARMVPSLTSRVLGGVPGGAGAAGAGLAAAAGGAEAERYLLFGAVLAALGAAAERGPVVLILDDLHWADKPTLLMLRYLATAPDAPSVLVLASYRDTDVAPGHPLNDLLAALRRETGVERIALGGLSDAELLSLVETTAGQQLGDPERDLARAMFREADGNPLFVWEMLLHLVESGMVALDDEGRWVIQDTGGSDRLPENVRDVVSRRVSRLGEEMTRTLTLASVIGVEFDFHVLAAALGADPDALLDTLERAEAAALVTSVSPDHFAFVHALVARSLYGDLVAARRALAHRQVAEVLEARYPGETRAAELARHWAAASPAGEAAKAIDYACQAGAKALRALAPHEALRWFGQALAWAEQSPVDLRTRCDILLGLGDAQRQTGDPSFRETLLEAAGLARLAGDCDRLVRAALTNTRGAGAASEVDGERVAVLEAALDCVGAGDSEERARLLVHLAIEILLTDAFPRRKELSEEAVAIARRVGTPATLVQVLTLAASAILAPETLEQRVDMTAEAVRLAARLDDPVALFFATLQRTQAAVETADIAESNRCVRRLRELADQVGQPTLHWFARFSEASRLLLAGEADRAEAVAEEALAIGQEGGQPDALAVYGGQLVCIRWHQGRDAELVEFLRSVVDDFRLPVFQAALARILVEAGRCEEAGRYLPDIDTFPYDSTWATGLAHAAEAAVGLKRTDVCERIYGRLRSTPNYVIWDHAVCSGATDHALGILATALGRYDDAEQHFEDADRLLSRLGAPFFLGRTRLAHGRSLRERAGDAADSPGRARSLVENARDIAARHGCGGVERQAAELLDDW